LALGGAAVALIAAAPFVSADAPLADAEMRGDSMTVRQLIKQGADVNAAQGDGMTALHWAAVRGDLSQAQMLVYAGARVEATTRNGNYTPLHLASREGKAAVVKALLEAGASPNAMTNTGGATPLHFAAGNGNAEAIAALLDKKAPVNVRDSAWGQTPLMWAAAANRVAAIEMLIKHGADLKLTSKVEDMAAREKSDRAALALRARRIAALKAAEQPPVPPGGAAKTPAAMAKDSAAKQLTAAPTPLDSAGRARRAAANPANAANAAPAERALTYGDLVGNKGGLTALHFAVREGNVDAVMALLKAGADVNQVTAGDHTSPLLLASINGHFDLAKTLLEKGANVKLASDAGATPLYAVINIQWAAKSLYPQPTAQLKQQTTYLQLMEQMLEAGADPNARLTKHLWYMSYNFDLLGVNTTGATPFWRAAYGTDVPAMKLLIAHGADPKIPTLKPAGRQLNADGQAAGDDSAAVKADPSGLPPVLAGGPGVFAIHAASGVGYGEGFAANSHQHAPDGWLPSVKYLVEELHMDVNARDFNGYNAVHHAAARGDNQLIEYLVSKGADINAVSRKGETTVDMANGPVQRIPPFPETVTLLEKLGAKNSHKCKSC
jgi:ankyrin repeat protein